MGNLFDFPEPGDFVRIIDVTGVGVRAERSALKKNHVWIYIQEELWIDAVRRGRHGDCPAFGSLLFPGNICAMVPTQIVVSA